MSTQKEIARKWVEGARIDDLMPPDKTRLKRVSLPSYPFKRTRCWFDLHLQATKPPQT